MALVSSSVPHAGLATKTLLWRGLCCLPCSLPHTCGAPLGPAGCPLDVYCEHAVDGQGAEGTHSAVAHCTNQELMASLRACSASCWEATESLGFFHLGLAGPGMSWCLTQWFQAGLPLVLEQTEAEVPGSQGKYPVGSLGVVLHFTLDILGSWTASLGCFLICILSHLL